MSLQPGHTIGPYSIVEQIGAGGMAAVYKAFQSSLSRHVAIKILPASYALDPEFLERFRQEAVVIANLRHPNIVVVFDTGEQDDLTYIVMELIEGGTLNRRMRGIVPLDEATALLRPIASALDFAHGRGIVHRDVKPPNVLLHPDGTPILSDFGIARILEGSRRITRTGMGIGTPEYIAPEQARGEAVGPAADNYALGVIAYEMLTGRLPFISATPMAVAVAHAEQPVPSARTSNPALSEEIDAVLLRALAKRPDDRFASAADLVQALEAAGSGQNSPAAPIPGAQPGAPTPPETPSPGSETIAVTPHPEPGAPAATIPIGRSRRGLLVGGALLGALIAIVAGFAAFRVLAVPDSAGPPTDAGRGAAAQSSAARVLYEDRFDDPAGGRLPKSSTNPAFVRGYVDGEYQIRVVEPTMRTIANAFVPGIQSDATMTVDAHLVGDTASRYIELVCRAQSDNTSSYYRLEMDTTRRWIRLVRLDAGTIVPVVEWTPSSSILPRNATNTVALACVGSTISANVNGTQVFSVQDTTYREGRMWIGLSSVGRVGEARFDNLKVLGAGSGSSANEGI